MQIAVDSPQKLKPWRIHIRCDAIRYAYVTIYSCEDRGGALCYAQKQVQDAFNNERERGNHTAANQWVVDVTPFSL
jgi:hypothetical protein